MNTQSVNDLGTDTQHLETTQPVSADIAQLRFRVEDRLAEQEKNLAELAADSDQGRAFAASIQIARKHLGDGWDRISETAASQLSHWLDTTEDLRVTSPGISDIKKA